jgi:flagella basal body P-ring formation protein FlgA
MSGRAARFPGACFLGAFGVAVLFAAPLAAEPRAVPVPAQVIYPGDRITAAMLVDSEEAGGSQDAILWERAEIVGKVARRTLLPGRAIPSIAVEEPRAISIGALAPLVYEQDGLSIVTTGQALQNGYAGQLVQVRNLDSGIVVTGIVQPDGSIRCKDG